MTKTTPRQSAPRARRNLNYPLCAALLLGGCGWNEPSQEVPEPSLPDDSVNATHAQGAAPIRIDKSSIDRLAPGERLFVELHDGPASYLFDQHDGAIDQDRIVIVCPNGRPMEMRAWSGTLPEVAQSALDEDLFVVSNLERNPAESCRVDIDEYGAPRFGQVVAESCECVDSCYLCLDGATLCRRSCQSDERPTRGSPTCGGPCPDYDPRGGRRPTPPVGGGNPPPPDPPDPSGPQGGRGDPPPSDPPPSPSPPSGGRTPPPAPPSPPPSRR